MSYVGSYTNTYLYKEFEYPIFDIIFSTKTHITLESFTFPDGEISEAQYFSIQKIPYSNIAFDSHIKALKQYISTL